jgi:hypothetical protein
MSLDILQSKLNPAKIAGIFDVWNKAHPNTPQHVIIIDDGSFVCTCLLLVNNGIVCRHFFHLMTVEKTAKYHIHLIPRRWYKEEIQSNPSIVTSKLPFTSASSIKIDTVGTPQPSYMAELKTLFPSTSAPRPALKELTRMQKYGELNGLYRRVTDQAMDDPATFERFKTFMTEELTRTTTNAEIGNPIVMQGKGRPKKKRIASIFESSKKVCRSKDV